MKHKFLNTYKKVEETRVYLTFALVVLYVVAGANPVNPQELLLIDLISGIYSEWYTYAELKNGTNLDSGNGSYTHTFLVN